MWPFWGSWDFTQMHCEQIQTATQWTAIEIWHETWRMMMRHYVQRIMFGVPCMWDFLGTQPTIVLCGLWLNWCSACKPSQEYKSQVGLSWYFEEWKVTSTTIQTTSRTGKHRICESTSPHNIIGSLFSAEILISWDVVGARGMENAFDPSHMGIPQGFQKRKRIRFLRKVMINMD